METPKVERTHTRSKPVPPLLPGAVVADRFEVQCELARGGMGIVYVALDGDSGRKVALKALLPPSERAALHEFERRFEKEIRILNEVSDQRILRPIAWGRDGDLLYFVSDLLIGETLADALRREGRFDERRVVRILTEISRALAEVHAAGYVHRDIKPGNIYLQRGRAKLENVWLLDFGIAKAFAGKQGPATLTAANVIVGSPISMAPEQVLGESIRPATDVYALGVVAYTCLTGSPPFSGEDEDILYAHRDRKPPPMSQRSPDLEISPSLEHLVMLMLEKEPCRRPEDAARILRYLEGVDARPNTAHARYQRGANSRQGSSIPSSRSLLSPYQRRFWMVFAVTAVVAGTFARLLLPFLGTWPVWDSLTDSGTSRFGVSSDQTASTVHSVTPAQPGKLRDSQEAPRSDRTGGHPSPVLGKLIIRSLEPSPERDALVRSLRKAARKCVSREHGNLRITATVLPDGRPSVVAITAEGSELSGLTHCLERRSGVSSLSFRDSPGGVWFDIQSP